MGVERIGEDRGKDRGARDREGQHSLWCSLGFLSLQRVRDSYQNKIKDCSSNNNFVEIIKYRQIEKPTDRNTAELIFFFFFFKSTE